MTTTTLALIIAVAILAQIAVAILWGYFSRRNRPAQPTATAGAAVTAPESAGWVGDREFVVKRRVFENRKGCVCSFYLAPADARPLPAFRPGQYLTFRLTVADPASGKQKSVTRCYSLSDSPHPDYYRVSIKRVPAGLVSNHFHDDVHEGSRLLVKAPAGHFHLQDDMLPTVLIGSGIGITPLLSMVNTLAERGDPRSVRLYYGVRNGAEHVMKDHLNELAAAIPKIHLHVCYSDPGPDDLQGRDYRHHGRIDIGLLRSTLEAGRHRFYVCGPTPMMESLVPALREWGVADDDLHYEAFGPSSFALRTTPTDARRAAHACTVTFSRSGKTLNWNGESESLLELAESNGIAVDSGCRAGSCGGCQTVLEAGEVRYHDTPDADITPGHCLLCVGTPAGNITLAA